jgi:hypothetical protein
MGTADPPAVRYKVFVSVGATAVDFASATESVIVAVETDANDVMLPMVYVPAVAPLPLMAALTFESLDEAVNAPEDAKVPSAVIAVVRVPTSDCSVVRAVTSLFSVVWSFCRAVTGTWAICWVRVRILSRSDEYLLTPVKVWGFAIRARALATEVVDIPDRTYASQHRGPAYAST